MSAAARVRSPRPAARTPGRTIVGADLSPAYLQQAHRNAPSGLYAAADAGRLALRDAVFAASLAQLVLNFVPDPAGAVAEMHRVTQPGGIVAASVWDFRGGLIYQRLFWTPRRASTKAPARPVTGCSPRRWRPLKD